MGFLFPAMLAGLLGLAIPTIIHLIARHRFPVQAFPSIRLLQREERTNVFAPKLVDVGQLLLRLLVLLLLVLAMARWFGGAGGAVMGGTAAPRNLVVVLDCSASMQMKAEGEAKKSLLEVAKERARELLKSAGPPSQCALVTAGAEATIEGGGLGPLEGAGSRSILEALGKAEAIDGTGAGLVRAVAVACEAVRGRREVKSQVVVLTDLRKSAFGNRSAQDLQRIAAARAEMGKKLEIVFIDVSSGAAGNVAIVETTVRGGQVKVGDDAHVLARVLNSSDKEVTAKVRLSVGTRREPVGKDIVLGAGAEAVVDLTSRVNRTARTFAEVSLEGDRLGIDDKFAVPLNVADVRRVLIVNGGTGTKVEADGGLLGGTAQPGSARMGEAEAQIDGATILRFVLNPNRELGMGFGTGIDSTAVAADAMAGQTLSKYDAVILYDVSSLPAGVLDDLDSFVREGRTLIVIPSGGVSAPNFNRSVAAGAGKRAALSPALLGNDRMFEVPVGIRQEGNAHAVLAPFKDRLAGDLSVIRFLKLRDVSNVAAGASVMFATANGQALALEMPLDRGKVILLTFGLELERGNIARTRAFPALMWRLLDYATDRLKVRAADVLPAITPAVLDVSEANFAFATELELSTPEGIATATGPATQGGAGTAGEAFKSIRLPITSDHTVLLPGLPAGQYLLHKARQGGEAGGANQVISYARYVTVHADARESAMGLLAAEEMTGIFGSDARVVANAGQIDLAPQVFEFWRTLVMVLVGVYLVEALVGWLLSARREKQRAIEMGATGREAGSGETSAIKQGREYAAGGVA